VKKRVVIIGANFSGLTAAAKLSNKLSVIVVDPRAFFQWTPNIHEILSGVKTAKSVKIASKTAIEGLGHCFINSEVLSIDATNHSLELSTGGTLQYDALLIASGQVRENWGIKGAENHAYGFRSTDDVEKLQASLNAKLKNPRSKEISVSIVGAGFTGVEVLGELLRANPNAKKLKINVIDSAARLISGLPEGVANDIVTLCGSKPVDFYFNEKIVEITASKIQLNSGKLLDSDITIWSAGTSLPSYLKNSGLYFQDNKGIVVNEFLQTTEYPEIFIAGDSAATINPLKKQASMALDMGPAAAKNIQKWLEGKAMKAFKPLEKPVALAFGDMNTYLIQGNAAVASPLLAAAKESVYQIGMAQLSAHLPRLEAGQSFFNRIKESLHNQLIPELKNFKPVSAIKRSRLILSR
jgi:NADH dehydrogenase